MRQLNPFFLIFIISTWISCQSVPETPDPWSLEGINNIVVIAECDPTLDVSNLLEAEVVKAIQGNTSIAIYERSQIEKILEELKLQTSDFIDGTQEAARLGKLKGVQALLIANASNYSSGFTVSLTVTFELIHIETGRTLEQHIENPWRLWLLFTEPEAEIPRLIGNAVEDFAEKKL